MNVMEMRLRNGINRLVRQQFFHSTLQLPRGSKEIRPIMVCGAPLQAEKFWRPAMNEAEEVSERNSICTALVAMHTNWQAKVST